MKDLQALIRTVLADGSRHVVLPNGMYSVPSPIRLGPEASGLTIESETPGGAVLTATRTIGPLTWEPWEDHPGAFRATCDLGAARIDRLFADGIEFGPARFPKRRPGEVPLEGATSAAAIRERRTAWRHPETGFVRALHNLGWGGNSYFIDSLDDGDPTGLRLRWVGDNNRGSDYDPNALVVENILEELTAPGEFSHDPKAGVLYLIPPEGKEPPQSVEAAAESEILSFRGDSPEAPVRGIILKGLRFERTARSLFSGKTYEPLLRGDWCVQRTGAVVFGHAEDCHIEGCSFRDIGGNALFLDGHAKGIQVRDCEFHGLGASGIQVCGHSSAVHEPSFWSNHHTSVERPDLTGPAGPAYASDILIENCRIAEIGLLEKQSSGVNVSIASRVRILRSTIHGSARSCVNFNDGTFGGHELAYCRLYDAQRETKDHGPFNSWGRDRFWTVPAYNAMGENGQIIRHYPAADGKTYDLPVIDCVERNRIHHNAVLHDPATGHSWGIDMDDGSSRYDVVSNLTVGCGIKLREGFERIVRGNLVVGGTIDIHVPYAEARDTIEANIIVSDHPFDLVGETERLLAAEPTIRNNAVSSEVPAEIAAVPGGSGTLLPAAMADAVRILAESGWHAPADWRPAGFEDWDPVAETGASHDALPIPSSVTARRASAADAYFVDASGELKNL